MASFKTLDDIGDVTGKKVLVRVDLNDPADPHPYWLVSTRHPERLADALRQEVTA